MSPERIISIACVALFVASSLVLAYDDEAQPVVANNCATGGTKDQLVTLSKLLDPSGRLAKIIDEFKIDQPQPNAVVVEDPKKRSASAETEEMQAAATTTNITIVAAPPAMTDPSTTMSPSTTSTTTPTPTTTSTAAPVTQPEPKVAVPNNVTVNVFLQLAPDPKTDEIISNPNNISSPSPSAQTEQVVSTQAPASSTTQISTTTSAESSTQSSSSTTTTSTVAPTTTSSSTTAAPSSKRRRRRDVTQMVSSEVAKESGSTSTAPSSSTTATSTTESAPASSTAPSSTTTTTSTPSASSTASTTTTTTTTTTLSTTSAPSSTTAASTSTSPATVEISAKDLPTERAMRVEAPATIEIVVSSVATSPAAPATANSGSPATAESAPVPTIAVEAPTTGSTTTATAPSSTTTVASPSPSASPSSTESEPASATITTSASTSTTTTTTTTTPPSTSQTPAAAPAVNAASAQAMAAPVDMTAVGMLTEDMKEIARVAKQPNLSGDERPFDEDLEFNPGYTSSATHTPLKPTTTPPPITNQSEALPASSTTTTPITLSNIQSTSTSAHEPNIDNLNVIYDNDTTIVELPVTVAKQQQPVLVVGTQQGRTPSTSSKSMSDFVNSDRTEENERENYATCQLESINNTTSIIGLIGRLNFWQPIQARGALHLLARLRYLEKQQERQLPQKLSGLDRRRRESFRAPVERAPAEGTFVNNTKSKLSRHQIWLQPNGCFSLNDRRLLVEISQTNLDETSNGSSSRLIDIDAELMLSQFNLSGQSNVIIDKYLTLESPNGIPLGCCKVSQTERMISSELDSLPSVSVLQPTRD